MTGFEFRARKRGLILEEVHSVYGIHNVSFKDIKTHWTGVLRLARSIKHKVVTTPLIIKKLVIIPNRMALQRP